MWCVRMAIVVGSIGALVTLASPCAAEPPAYAEHQDLSYYLDDAGQRQTIESAQNWEQRRAHVVAHMESVMGPLPRPEQPVPLYVQTQETVEPRRRGRPQAHHVSHRPDRPADRSLSVRSETCRRRETAGDVVSASDDEDRQRGAVRDRRLGKPALWHASGAAGLRHVGARLPVVRESADYDFEADAYISGSMKAIYDNTRAVDLLQSLRKWTTNGSA